MRPHPTKWLENYAEWWNNRDARPEGPSLPRLYWMWLSWCLGAIMLIAILATMATATERSLPPSGMTGIVGCEYMPKSGLR